MVIHYGEIMLFAISAFRTQERMEINGLINELLWNLKKYKRFGLY